MITKKNNVCIALLLTMITFNVYTMESTNDPIELDDTQHSSCLQLIKNALVGGTSALKQLLLYVYSGAAEIDPFPFTSLPEDMQIVIISLIIKNNTARSLKEAAHSIDALAQVNHQLNTLINNPEFCLQIIWHLAEQFDCSDEAAAQALQTEEAQQRLKIQKQFGLLFSPKKKFNEEKFKQLYEKYKDYIDIDFTYSELKMTLLMLATYATNSATQIYFLLNIGAIDINKASGLGMTALMLSALNSTDPETIQLLCEHPTININQQDNEGNTALLLLCKLCNTERFKLENLKILIDAGADPEIPDNTGITPLQEAMQLGNNEAIDLINDAITKKLEI
jgi:hypothetical protein